MSLQSPAASSHGNQPVPEPGIVDRAPRLGEFSQLMNSAKSVFLIDVTDKSRSQSHHASGESERESELRAIETQAQAQAQSSKLGDFHKLRDSFQPLRQQSKDARLDIESSFSELAIQAPGSPPPIAKSLPCRIRRRRNRSRSKRLSDPPLLQHSEPLGHILADLSSPELDITSESDQYSDTRGSALTPASTPPTPRPEWPFSEPRKHGSNWKLWSPTATKAREEPSNEQANVLFSYNNGKGYLPVQVYGRVLSREEKHRTLLLRLSLHRAVDATIAEQFPAIATQGTHVFIDMSNIDINFLQALKARHMLGDRAYPVPRTHMDLELLTEVLVRGRPTATRSVGCSVVPGRHRPWYVPQLKRLGYHVDLRPRKPVQDPGSSSSSPLCVRYVEDLVDETLQTRIAEAVMEYFDRQGTIVLATGDAKPAEYSDGFFTYVERALRMGWNVELASWKSSLSSTWTGHKWKAQWGNKFRIIELDSYLDLLLANDA